MERNSISPRSIIVGIVLVVIICVAGFLYRNDSEQMPLGTIASTTSSGQACTADAKICPDGSAVGRTGPNCSFAACALPNVELTTASSTIGFVLPAGYMKLEQGAPSQSTLAIYQKPADTGSATDTLTVSAYPVTGDGTPILLMLANTIFDPSGQQATSSDAFKAVTAGNNTFYEVTVGRFEGQVETEYYLPSAGDTSRTLYRFDLVERGVANWADPNLTVSALPEHRSLVQTLSTVQVSGK